MIVRGRPWPGGVVRNDQSDLHLASLSITLAESDFAVAVTEDSTPVPGLRASRLRRGFATGGVVRTTDVGGTRRAVAVSMATLEGPCFVRP